VIIHHFNYNVVLKVNKFDR